MELEQLRARFEKLEKERNDYKQSTERLETKVGGVLSTVLLSVVAVGKHTMSLFASSGRRTQIIRLQ